MKNISIPNNALLFQFLFRVFFPRGPRIKTNLSNLRYKMTDWDGVPKLDKSWNIER